MYPWKRPDAGSVDVGPSVWPYADPGVGQCRYTDAKGLQGSCFPRCSAETTRKVYEAFNTAAGDKVGEALAGDKTPAIKFTIDGVMDNLDCEACAGWQNYYCITQACPTEAKASDDCYAKADPNAPDPCPKEDAKLNECLLVRNLATYSFCFETVLPLCFAPEFERARKLWNR